MATVLIVDDDPTIRQLLTLSSLIGSGGQLDSGVMIQTVRQTGSQVIVIDGFQGVPELFVAPLALRQLLDSLAKLAQMLRCTVLVTMEGDGRDPQHGPALTMADLVIDLDYQIAGWRHVRRLDVVKQRGHPALAGLHSYTITDDGVVVFPRLEARLPAPPLRRSDERLAFGVPELDRLLGGGLPVGAAAVVAAGPGSGKTTLALRWALAAAQVDHTTLFLTFHTQPARLVTKAAALGLDLAGALEQGTCALLYVSPVAIDPDAVAGLLLGALGPTTRRVIIDDLGGLLWELGSRARDYLAALALHLSHAGAATLFLLESGVGPLFPLDTAYSLIAPIAEMVLTLEEQVRADQIQRVARVVTMRFGTYAPREREVVLHSLGQALPKADAPADERGAG